jgi:hypothetical protein
LRLRRWREIESLLPAPFHFGIWVACVATKKIFALTDSRINDGLNSAESFIHREFLRFCVAEKLDIKPQ